MGIDAEMYVETDYELTDQEVLDLSYDVGVAFGADKFHRDFKSDGKWWPAHHNISKVAKVEQDGPDYNPPPGKFLLRVHIWTRYYGPGYERGDFPFLYVLAEWLEAKIPGAIIRYGGDSSGVLAEVWDRAARRKFMQHFAGPDSRAYFGSANRMYPGDGTVQPVCENCKKVMSRYGYGGGIGNPKGAYSCGGCGLHKKTEDGIKFENFEGDWV